MVRSNQWESVDTIGAVLAAARNSAEAEGDEDNISCTECALVEYHAMRGLLLKALTRSAIVHPGFADEIRAALKVSL